MFVTSLFFQIDYENYFRLFVGSSQRCSAPTDTFPPFFRAERNKRSLVLVAAQTCVLHFRFFEKANDLASILLLGIGVEFGSFAGLDSLAGKLGYKELDDWYRARKTDFYNNEGGSLLQAFDGSPSKLLSFVYPHHNWKVWKFGTVSKGYWNDKENRKNFLDELGRNLGYNQLDDWYNISNLDFVNSGGTGLLKFTILRLLQSAYPEHTWYPWKFTRVAEHYWEDTSNCKQFLEYLKEQCDVKTDEDWGKVTHQEIRKHGGRALTEKYQSIPKMLAAIYPTIDLSCINLLKSSGPERKIWDILKTWTELGEDLLQRHKPPDLIYSKSNRTMELDFFFPAVKLALEYQGNVTCFSVNVTQESNTIDRQTLARSQLEVKETAKRL